MTRRTGTAPLSTRPGEPADGGGLPGGWIVELEPGVWSRRCDGDPGRTLRRDFATVYESEGAARKALTEARSYRPFRNARILPRADTAENDAWVNAVREIAARGLLRPGLRFGPGEDLMDAEVAADRAATHQPGSPDEPWVEVGDAIPARSSRGNPPWKL